MQSFYIGKKTKPSFLVEILPLNALIAFKNPTVKLELDPKPPLAGRSAL